MRNCLSWAALPLLAAGCAAPLPNLDDTNLLLENSVIPMNSGTLGNSGTRSGSGPRFQDEDYSPSGMFMTEHGEFMLQRKRYEPMVFADILWQPNSDIKSEPGSFDLTHYRVDGKVPLALDPDSYLELGAYFGARNYNTSASFPVGDDTLYDVGLYLGGGVFVSDEVLIEGLFYPGVYSDFDGDSLNHNDYQWYFDALAVWRPQEDLYWKFGLTHDGTFQDTEVYPLIGVSYAISSQWRLDILLPRSAEISYSPDASTILLADVTLDGDQFEMHSSALPGSSTSHVQEIRVGLGGIYRFNDTVSTFAKVGMTVAGDYLLTNGDGIFADGTLEPAVFFTAGVGLDF
jgi:hypothetical protein